MKPTTAPFPGLSDFTDANAPSVAPKFITYILPKQQNEFIEWAQGHHDGLARRGWRKWRNPSRQPAKMTFTLSPPMGWMRPATETEWPMRERKVTVVIEPGAECELPEIWSAGIVVVQGGEAVGGACPWLRPVGTRPIALADGIDSPKPFNGGEAA